MGGFKDFLDRLGSAQKSIATVIAGSVLASVVPQIGQASGWDAGRIALFTAGGALGGTAGLLVQYLMLVGRPEQQEDRILDNSPSELAFGIFVRIGLATLALFAYFLLARTQGDVALGLAFVAVVIAFLSFFSALTGAGFALDLAEKQRQRHDAMSPAARIQDAQQRRAEQTFVKELERDAEAMSRYASEQLAIATSFAEEMDRQLADETEITAALRENRHPVGLSAAGQKNWNRVYGGLVLYQRLRDQHGMESRRADELVKLWEAEAGKRNVGASAGDFWSDAEKWALEQGSRPSA